MLATAVIEQILGRIPALKIGVLGDLFLDRYLDLDAALTEPSIETGLDAYQVVRVRSFPGAAGTVINNLAVLGVGRICPIAVIGDDGEGYELRRALRELRIVAEEGIFSTSDRRTPTYTKPMLQEQGQPPRELNRLDIKNRTLVPGELEERIIQKLNEWWPSFDALLVLDQVSEEDCGVVTSRVREHLAVLGESRPDRLILADSRERIGLFRSVSLKPNEQELISSLSQGGTDRTTPEMRAEALVEFAMRAGRPVFCTRGKEGISLFDPREQSATLKIVPGYPITGPIDIVGAGDSTSAGIACAVAAGASLEDAAAFGNLIASITIQQIGVTGTASPAQVRQRWREVSTT